MSSYQSPCDFTSALSIVAFGVSTGALFIFIVSDEAEAGAALGDAPSVAAPASAAAPSPDPSAASPSGLSDI